MSNGCPTKNIIDPARNNEVVVKDAPNTVPDQIMFHGLTTPSNTPVTIHFKGGESFPGTPNMDWRILGTNGEIRLTGPSESLNVGRKDTKVELYDVGSGKIEILVGDPSPLDELPFMAHNIARQYEAFRKGEWYPDFEWAVRRHEIIDEMWKQYDRQTQ
jgi:predicted dehydrogenase